MYGFVVADNADTPFCAVVISETGAIVEARPYSAEAEEWAEARAAWMNLGG